MASGAANSNAERIIVEVAVAVCGGVEKGVELEAAVESCWWNRGGGRSIGERRANFLVEQFEERVVVLKPIGRLGHE